ncbi:zinc finger transcription factor YY1 isoform X1 [Curcuma longa]|uniref:zinc finger transcription factor YY1 isoform X1 n=1 Tax=Curcuma longa TaxID=136217 RepID=UPI003D9EEC9F
MDLALNHPAPERRPADKDYHPTTVRWVKEWVPQDVVATGGKCFLLKWVTEDMLKAIKEKSKETEEEELKPEPATEVLFLCSYEGCGKTFIDAGALKKHAHIHGEKQHICQYEGCGKKFLDSSKLKRHYLIHTGERDFICPHEGCGKAFSLDFNLRAHMKTHSVENYHVCPYLECGKRYINESKLRTHMKTHHDKNNMIDAVKHTPAIEKPHTTPKAAATGYSSASVQRPYACPYEGCEKAYIHEYKLNLHFKREHPGHNSEENNKAAAAAEQGMEEGSDQEAYVARGARGKNAKRSKPNPTSQLPPAKVKRKVIPPTLPPVKKQQWPSKDVYEEDSEETEEDRDNVEGDGWRYQEVNGDDEETEDED